MQVKEKDRHLKYLVKNLGFSLSLKKKLINLKKNTHWLHVFDTEFHTRQTNTLRPHHMLRVV